MIYKYTIDDGVSGIEALKIAHRCGKYLKNDIDFIFDKHFMSVTVTFYIDEEDDEAFKERCL